jgi:hypothetical protein
MELSGLYTKFSHCEGAVLTLYGKNLRVIQDKKRGCSEQHYVYYYCLGKTENSTVLKIPRQCPLLRKRVGLVQGKAFGSDEVRAIASEVFNT